MDSMFFWRKKVKASLRNTALAAVMSMSIVSQSFAATNTIESAQEAVRQGNLRDAEIQLKNALQAKPGDGATRYELGLIELRLGDLTGAESEARRALKDGYDADLSTELLMRSYISGGRYKELLHDFPTINPTPGKQDSASSSIMSARAVALDAMGQGPDADKALAVAKELSPNSIYPLLALDRIARGRGDKETAKAAILKAYALKPNDADIIARMASDMEIAGDKEGAMKAYIHAIELDPTNAAANLGRIGLLITQGKTDEAKTALDLFLKPSPNDPRARYLHAVLAAKSKDWKTADDDLTAAFGLMAALPSGYLLLASVKDGLGQHEQALEAARKYSARNPSDKDGAYYVAQYALKANHPDQAHKVLLDAFQNGTAGPRSLAILASMQMSSGDAAGAIISFKKALELVPGNRELTIGLAQAEASSGNPDKAAETLETLPRGDRESGVDAAIVSALTSAGQYEKASQALAAYKANPKSSDEIAANLSADLAIAKLDYATARHDLQSALASHPNSVKLLSSLARLDLRMGDIDGAKDSYKKILAVQPSDLTVVAALSRILTTQGDAVGAQKVIDGSINDKSSENDKLLAASLSLQQKRPNDVIRITQDLTTSLVPNISATAFGLRAEAFVILLKSSDAIAAASKALEITPANVKIRVLLATLQASSKDLDSAKKTILDGLRTAPHDMSLLDADLRCTASLARQSGGNIKVAEEAMLKEADKLAASDTHMPEASFLKARILEAIGRNKDAEIIYASLLQRFPNVQFALAYANTVAHEGDNTRAIQILKDWTTKNPNDIRIREALSALYMADKNYTEAEKELTAVISVKSTDPVALNNMAWIMLYKGDKASALSYAERAYAASPNPQTADTLGWSRLQMLPQNAQPTSETLILLEKASKAMPTNMDITYHYAVALERSGNKADAKKLLTSILKDGKPFDAKDDATKLLHMLSGN
jgi:cellulose synthase operon protein C